MESLEYIPEPAPKKRSFWRFLKRLFYTLFFLGILLPLLSLLLIYIYEDDVKRIIIAELNKNLQSEVQVAPENIDLTVISTFPYCALEFKDVTVMEPTHLKSKDTLMHIGTFRLGFNMGDLFRGNYVIRKIIIDDADLRLKVDKQGQPNYIIWKTTTGAASGESKSLKFEMEDIALSNIRFSYNDRRTKFKTSITLDKARFAGNFSDKNYQLESMGMARLHYLQWGTQGKVLQEKNLSYAVDFDVKGPAFHIKTASLSLNNMQFAASGNLQLQDSLQAMDIHYKGTDLDIAAILSLLPDHLHNKISDYESEGLIYAEGDVSYKSGQPFALVSKFGIQNATITYKVENTKLSNVRLLGQLQMKNNTGSLQLNEINARLGNNTFEGQIQLSNFSDPYLNCRAKINTRLDELMKFWPIDTLQKLEGNLQLEAVVEGRIADMKQGHTEAYQAKGAATLSDVRMQLKGHPNDINIPQGKFELDNQNVAIRNFTLLHGSSDFTLTGELPEFMNYLFDPHRALRIDAALQSRQLKVEDILVATSGKSSAAAGSSNTYSVSIPANLHFDLQASIGQLSFGKMEAKNIHGAIAIANQKLALNQLHLSTMDGEAEITAVADASGKTLDVTAACQLQHINIQKLFYQLNNFGQTTLQDKNIRGFATANIDFSCQWSKTLQPNMNSLKASSTLNLEQGELIGFKPMESLGQFVAVKELQHIKFSNLQSLVEIKNQSISFPKTSIKSSLLTIELSGRHTFTNEIEYHLQFLMEELRVLRQRQMTEPQDELRRMEMDPDNHRTVFIVMTGTVDHPKPRYDMKGAREKIKDDIKQEKQNLKLLLKEELGLFKKDTTLRRQDKASDQKFQIERDNATPAKPNTLQPKKRPEEEEDF